MAESKVGSGPGLYGSMDSTGSSRFARIICLLMEEGTKAMREAVLSHLYPCQPNLRKTLKSQKQKFLKLLKQQKIRDKHFETLYPPHGDVREEDIDMSLWFILARNVTVDHDDKSISWSGSPNSLSDMKWQHDVIRIKDMRNRLFHLGKGDLTEKEFKTAETELTLTLTNLGISETTIEDYLSRDLDPGMTQRCKFLLQNQVNEELQQVALAAAREKKQISFLIVLVVSLCVSVVVCVPVMVVYLKPKPPCAASLIRISSDGGVLNYMERKGWGALPALRQDTDPMPTLKLPLNIAGVLHTAIVQTDCQATEDCCQVVRYLQKAHMNGGWDDIAYNFVIANDGVVYEGRGAYKQGAAIKYKNEEIISIALLGNFMCEAPSRTSLMALYVFLEHLTEFNPEDRKIFRHPVLHQDYGLYGHCQLNEVRIPGHNKTFPNSPGAALMLDIMNWNHWRNDNISACAIYKDCLKPTQCCKPCNGSSFGN